MFSRAILLVPERRELVDSVNRQVSRGLNVQFTPTRAKATRGGDFES